MTELKLGGRSYEGAVVEIGEHRFRTLPLTRSVTRKMRPLAEKMVEAQMAGDDDAVIAAMAAMFDVRLTPADGARKKASSLINELWKADKLTRGDLDDFADELAEADRPT